MAAEDPNPLEMGEIQSTVNEECIRNTLLPSSLVMRKMECFYCGAEDTKVVMISYLFGMKTCDLHERWANRDCKAYMHTEGIVLLKDARKIAVIDTFCSVLKNNKFSVERSNLTVDPGWELDECDYPVYSSFCRNGEKWGVPVKHVGQHLYKKTPIINFLRPEIIETLTIPANWSEIIEGTIDVLIEGIYLAEHTEYTAKQNKNMSPVYPELDNVVHIEYEGASVRLMIPQSVLDSAR